MRRTPLSLLTCLLCGPGWGTTLLLAGMASADAVREYELKAAYLFNFVKFVEWPEPALGGGQPLTICVLGRDPFGAALERATEGKAIGGHSLKIRRSGNSDELRGCQVLFIASDWTRTRETLHSLASAAVLTVSESGDFLSLGGMIRLLIEDNKLRFEVNGAAAKRQGLAISSRLLSLAKTVWE